MHNGIIMYYYSRPSPIALLAWICQNNIGFYSWLFRNFQKVNLIVKNK